MSSFDLYLITRLDYINSAAGIGSFICCIIFGMAFVVMLRFKLCEYSDDPKDAEEWKGFIPAYKAIRSMALLGFLVFLPVFILVPTTKEAALIYALPKIVNNEDVRAESKEIYELCKSALKGAVEGEKK